MGDILCINAVRHPGHVGIYVGNGNVIHALGWEALGFLPIKGKVIETPLKAAKDVPSFYEDMGHEDGNEDHDHLGAKTHKDLGLLSAPEAATLRSNIVMLAREQLGEGYDNGGGQQKGDGPDTWTCSGFSEKIYESCAQQELQYAATYGNEDKYVGGLNITPDGYDWNFIDLVCYYQKEVEFSQLPTLIDLPGDILGVFSLSWGRKFGIVAHHFAFFPYTQFEQPTLTDSFPWQPAVPQVTITSSAGEGGSIEPSGASQFPKGANATFTATAGWEYVVDRWYLDLSPVQTGGATFQLPNVQSDCLVEVTFRHVPNQAPTLTNPRVEPLRGTTETEFEFLVDYQDLEGQPPSADYRHVNLSDGRSEKMSPKSGQDGPGTYAFKTRLPQGNYAYGFFFADSGLRSVSTPMQQGPWVYASGQVPINIVVQCQRISSDMRLKYSLNDIAGPWTDLPLTKSVLDPVFVPAGASVTFQAEVTSPNFEYRGWEGYDKGSRFGSGGPGNAIWSFRLATGTTEVGLDVFYAYTPQNYRLNGTVKHTDGSLVPGGVDLALSSSEQTMQAHTDDGNFSFSGVKGGVSVTLKVSAKGHQFSPPYLVFANLRENRTENITAYASDDWVPMTTLSVKPPEVSESSTVSFGWASQDDVSQPASLQHQWKLDGVDADWSAWSTATSKSYNLPNGAYTFWVRAKDEAGNINQAPVNHTFAVNAAPKVASVARITRSVWATRLTLQNSTDAVGPADRFVLLPEHSPWPDAGLVPVALHRKDDPTPVGANAIVAAQLRVTPSIAAARKGWLVALPAAIVAGQGTEVDVVWGKTSYFGWQEFVPVPRGFPNVGQESPLYYKGEGWIGTQYLDDNERLWRVAGKRREYSGGLDQGHWLFMDAADRNGSVISEAQIRFDRGRPFVQGSGVPGIMAEFYNPNILEAAGKIVLVWVEEMYTYDGDTLKQTQDWRFGLEAFDVGARRVSDFDGQFARYSLALPSSQTIGENVWILGSKNASQSSGGDAWFLAIDANANQVIPQTAFDTVGIGGGYYDSLETLWLGDGALLLWTARWNTPNNSSRRVIKYQVRAKTGGLVKNTETLSPCLPDSVDKDDDYSLSSHLADKVGRVWISLHRSQGGNVTYHYAVIGADGGLWKAPVQLSAPRSFLFCDSDGKIWVTEGAQLLLLNDDDTVATARSGAVWVPNQAVGTGAASVQPGGYRLFDRWSPHVIEVTVPAGAKPATAELYDLNLWTNNLHAANLAINKGGASVWSKSGQFTGHVSVPGGFLAEGQNILTLTQDDLLGGQVLLTFPYVVTHSIEALASEHGHIAPTGQVNVHHGADQAFTITPDEGYRVADVLADGQSVGAQRSYTFTNVTSNHSISAAFQPDILPPTIVKQPESRTNFVGETAIFGVEAAGTAPLAYQWKFNGSDIAGAKSAVLVVQDVQPGNAGAYVAEVRNIVGASASQPARLTVLTPPTQVVRDLPGLYTNGVPFTVTIRVTPPEGAAFYALQDKPPAGWPVKLITDGGTYANGKVGWIFNDGTARTLLYTVTPPASAFGNVLFLGDANWGGATTVPIAGQQECRQFIDPKVPRLLVAQVRLLDATYIKLTVQGQPGIQYSIQTASNLSAGGSWITRDKIMLTEGAKDRDWLDLDPMTNRERFYRAALEP